MISEQSGDATTAGACRRPQGHWNAFVFYGSKYLTRGPGFYWLGAQARDDKTPKNRQLQERQWRDIFNPLPAAGLENRHIGPRPPFRHEDSLYFLEMSLKRGLKDTLSASNSCPKDIFWRAKAPFRELFYQAFGQKP